MMNCPFCGNPIGDDDPTISDSAGEVACLACGQAELEAQRRERQELSYSDFYRNLDGLTALATAGATPLRRQKDEKDTAFVKRIVATYLSLAHKAGVHQQFQNNQK